MDDCHEAEDGADCAGSPLVQRLEAQVEHLLALVAPPRFLAVPHGYTGHGHRCCREAPLEAPADRRRKSGCGGPGRCARCASDREGLHTAVAGLAQAVPGVASAPATAGRLIATRGLPGSGKTTWAKAQPGWRVNRDDIRAMFSSAWDYSRADDEDAVTAVQYATIRILLGLGRTVLVDDTNLRPSTLDALRAIAVECGAEFHVEDFTHVPVEVCLERDAARQGRERVGERVIRDMHERHLARPASPTDA